MHDIFTIYLIQKINFIFISKLLSLIHMAIKYLHLCKNRFVFYESHLIEINRLKYLYSHPKKSYFHRFSNALQGYFLLFSICLYTLHFHFSVFLFFRFLSMNIFYPIFSFCYVILQFLFSNNKTFF